MRTAFTRLLVGTTAALLIFGLLPGAAWAAVPATVDDSTTVLEDGSANVDVLANDGTDAGALSVTSVTQPANGTATIAVDGLSVDYEPDPNFHGSDDFTYVATNLDGDSSPTNVTVTVTADNDPPVADNELATVAEDASPTTIPVLTGDTDPDGDTLTIQSASDPLHGTVIVAGNDLSLTYEPDANYHGSDNFTYVVTDGNGGTDTGSVTVTVTPENDPPIADDETLTVAEDALATTVPVLTGDTDPDGDTLTIQSAGNPAHGTVVIAGNDLSLSYRPDAEYNGPDDFTYVVTDGNGGFDTGTVTVTVTAGNDPPVADNEVVTVAEDASPTPVPVLTGDTDPDGDTLTIQSAGDPLHGTVVVAANDLTLTYEPDADYNGPDGFTYVVTDGNGGFDTGTVNVTVTAGNDPPVADDETLSVAEDTGGTTVAVLVGDTDADGDTLTIQSASDPTHGTVVVAANDLSLSYQPDPNYHGSDNFTYVVSDGNGGTDTGTVTVTVTSENDPPIAEDETLTVAEDASPTTVPVLTGDTDADNDALTIQSASDPAHGTVVVAGNELSLTYEPDADYNGSDTFTYVVTDGNGGTDTGSVTVTVTSQNDPPTVVDDEYSTPEDAPVGTVFVLQNDSDIDGGALSITSTSNPPHGASAVSAGGLSVTYVPDSSYSGSDTFTYTVIDGQGGTSIGTVTVDVSGVNSPPNAVNDLAVSVPEGAGPTELPVLANDSDPDGDSFIILSKTNGAHGTVTILPGGAGLTYDPVSLYYGTDTFKYTLRDAGGLLDTATVVVTVTRDRTAPIVVAPAQRFLGQTVGTSTIKVRMTWSGSDPGSGIKSYQLQESRNGGTYTNVTLITPTRYYADRVLTNNASYRYRVRATDREGNVSGWRYSQTFKPAVFQESSGLATYTGAWLTYKTTGALGGAVKYTPTLGKKVAFGYTVYDVALVMTKTASSGSADIYVDGVLSTRINLRASKTTYRQLVYTKHFTTLGAHTIEIRPIGTGRVDIDGFAVLR